MHVHVHACRQAKTDDISSDPTDEERGQPSHPPHRSLSPSPPPGDAYAEVEVTQTKTKTTQLPAPPSEPSSDPHITVSLGAAAYEATDMQVNACIYHTVYVCSTARLEA